ncbi:hypothetical protein QCM77_05730 [Bradyrhizobium sp. SSUT18]|uniref:hypothetical protein n=1 Tax=Bradyrhizobium sp. SSUT18 TaxID=3040602 RepID=UPI00244D7627|nr:hypothetical protein [Bradyrhizobium sp. SSUT18]MDH2399448.1 hypothetical protein [Bradyrhizobium sp. SSUT18]
MSETDNYPGVTEFAAVPSTVSIDTIAKIREEAKNLQPIGTKKLLVSMGDHPELGAVLILDQDDGSGGFVFADWVRFT